MHKLFKYIGLLLIIVQFLGCTENNSELIKLEIYTLPESKNEQHTVNEMLMFKNWDTEYLKSNTISKGFNNNRLWIKIPTDSLKPFTHFKVNNALLDEINMYTILNDTVIHKIETGDNKKFNTREYPFNTFMFSIDSTSNYLLISAKTEGMLSLPFEFLDESDIINGKQSPEHFFIGLFVLALIFNLILILKLKGRLYLYFFLTITSIGFGTMADSGMLFQFLWPNHPVFNQYMMVFYSFIIFLLLFSAKFLDIKLKFPFLYKVYLLFYSCIFCIILLSLAGFYNYSIQIYMIFFFLVPPLCLVSGLLSFRKYKTPYILYFVAAIGLYMLFLNLYFLSFTGFIRNSTFINNSVQYANISEIVFLFLAVIDRFQATEKEKIITEQNLIEALKKNEDILQMQNRLLEERVILRTQEIESLNANISKVNQELTFSNQELVNKNDTLNRQKKELNDLLKKLKNAQDQLIQAEKMAALGVLTAGIAHELNNPINYVSITAQALESIWEDLIVIEKAYSSINTNNVLKVLKEIEKLKVKIHYHKSIKLMPNALKSLKIGVQRTIEIVNGLRQFSHKDNTQKTSANINEIIETTLLLLKGVYIDILTVNKKYGELPTIFCYPGRLQQVFMNILSNAIDAIPKPTNPTTDCITISTLIIDEFITILISDTGTGMPTAIMNKIFDPFYTTKEVGKGTGLGLSISHGIIQEHNGNIKVESTPGKGTTFIIKIPITN